MNAIAKYVVAAGSLAGGLWMLYHHEDARIAAGLIGFAGLLIDYAEVFGAASSLLKSWRQTSGT